MIFGREYISKPSANFGSSEERTLLFSITAGLIVSFMIAAQAWAIASIISSIFYYGFNPSVFYPGIGWFLIFSLINLNIAVKMR